MHSKYIILVLAVFIATGCAGVKTFPNTVQVGETAALAAGWKHHFSRHDITVTITPSSGPSVTYNAGDPEIRSVINFYPDPVSSLIVSQESGVEITNSVQTYANFINDNFTFNDKDYWQTVVFVDIPPVNDGLATVEISNSQGEISTSTVNILSTSGVSDEFDAEGAGPLTPNMLRSMERLDHYVVSFDGTTIPHAIELELSYVSLNGYLINPRGDLKNIAWTDTGSGYKVILMAANQPLSTMHDFKFYAAIAGGAVSITSLDIVPGSVKAFDSNGNVVSGVNAALVLERGAAGLLNF